MTLFKTWFAYNLVEEANLILSESNSHESFHKKQKI